MTAPAARRLRVRRHHVRQFVKFGVVGGSGVVVNLAVAVLLHRLHGGTAHAQAPLFGLPLTGKSFRYVHLVWIVSFLVANVWNFQLNRWWTFRAHAHASWWRQFLPFLAVGSVAAVVGLLFISWFTHPDSWLYLPDPWFTESVGLRSRTYWAQLITIALTMPVNFVVNKLWTFRAVRHHVPEADLPIVAPVVAPDLVDEDGHLEPPAGDRRGPA